MPARTYSPRLRRASRRAACFWRWWIPVSARRVTPWWFWRAAAGLSGRTTGCCQSSPHANADTRLWRITWQPEALSATFHGRDLFALIAADIARGEFPADKLAPADKLHVEFDAGDLPRVIYIDHYGNAWTGVRGAPKDARVSAAGELFKHSESFGFVGKGEGFWFVNSVGLLELAVNRGSAAEAFGLAVGDLVQVQRLN